MNIDKFTITSWDDLVGFDRVTGGLDMVLDELTDFSLANTQETSDVQGKGGRVISRLKKNKGVTGSGTNGFLAGGAVCAMVGGDVSNGEQEVSYTDTVVVNSNKGTTTEKAIGTAGNEIGTIYVRDANNMYINGGKKLTQAAATPAEGQFTYDPTTKEINFHEGDVADGTEVIMFYTVKKEGYKITNDANNYSKVLRVVVTGTCQDMCDNIFKCQAIIPRADFSGEFTLQGGSDPSTLGFEFTSLPDLCTGKTLLWDFIVFD